MEEHGSFRVAIEGTGWPRTARSPTFEEGVLHAVDQNPGTSIRALAVATRKSRTVHRVLPYIRFMYRECSYYKKVITHDVSRFAQWL
ncbi:hypothetical protein TNCT_21631 [Trichonephila clavata]|uniref:Uncharacterized protein n=1 Tax=Trichonephila clavata TaxID=2740835 RepID=A0A8X6FE92_TRICU|nr:hypothetical protein TNCT_21631 [Trichonephila clavata]